MSYIEDYTAHTDLRVAKDPREAIGGRWEEIGKLQVDLLKEWGFGRNSSIVDFGCGTGRLFDQLRTWHTGRYTGIDLSQAALNHLHILQHTDNPNRVAFHTFTEVPDDYPPSDFIMAHSVFTHLPPDYVTIVLRDLMKLMYEHTQLFFTYHPAEEYVQTNETNFRYPLEALLMLLPDGLQVAPIEYDHPRGQKMLRATRT